MIGPGGVEGQAEGVGVVGLGAGETLGAVTVQNRDTRRTFRHRIPQSAQFLKILAASVAPDFDRFKDRFVAARQRAWMARP